MIQLPVVVLAGAALAVVVLRAVVPRAAALRVAVLDVVVLGAFVFRMVASPIAVVLSELQERISTTSFTKQMHLLEKEATHGASTISWQ